MRTLSSIGMTATVLVTLVAGNVSGQIPLAGKTAAEVNKNIKVLKTLPASELVPAMQFMAGSLGVDCDHCHVTATGPWPMERDDKPTKLVARRMLTMVQEINATQFGGRNVVNCATCHRGSPQPLAVPPVFDPARAPQASAVAGADDHKETAPTVAQVLDRFVQAIGGREANARITSRAYKGTITAAGQAPVPFEVLEAAPDKLRATVGRPEAALIQNVDGETAWRRNAQGVMFDVTGQEAIRMRRLATFHKNEILGELNPSLAVAGTLSIDGRRAVLLEGPLASGQIERLLFDAGTGLLVRRVVLSPTAFGLLPEQTDYEDYRSVGDVKLPFLVRRTTVTSSNTQRYDSVTLNVPVDAAQFQKPFGR